jgi:PAS domain-containing protein
MAQNIPDSPGLGDSAQFQPVRDTGLAAFETLGLQLKSLCELAGLDAASLYYVSHGTRRILAGHHSPRMFCSYPDNPSTNPFKTTERLLAPDIDKKPQFRKALQLISSGIDTQGWKALIRLTIPVGDNERFGIVAFGGEARKAFSRSEIQAMDHIEQAIAGVCMELLPKLRLFKGRPGFPLELQELAQIVNESDHAMGLRDGEMNMLAASPHLEALTGRSNRTLLGQGIRQSVGSYSDAFAILTRHALDTGFTLPIVEVAIPISGTERLAHFEVLMTPVYLLGRESPVFVCHYQMPRGLRGNSIRNAPDNAGDDATTDFLFETLLKHRSIRTRGDISYVTLRSWSAPIRTHQIKALSALKRHAFEGAAERIAKEMCEEITRLAGFDGFSGVIPVPGGHSNPDSTFSVAIARAISRQAGLPFINAFEHQGIAGSSHPKSNVKRPSMIITTRIIRPVVLIDDVATSGRHIEECVSILRRTCKTVLAVAWIGGNLTPSKNS